METDNTERTNKLLLLHFKLSPPKNKCKCITRKEKVSLLLQVKLSPSFSLCSSRSPPRLPRQLCPPSPCVV